MRAALGEVLRRHQEPTAIQTATSHLLGLRFAVDRAFYAEVAPHGQLLIVSDYRSEDLPSLAGRHWLEAFGLRAAEALRAGQTVVIREVSGREGDEPAPLALGAGARLEVPVIKDGRLVALLGLHQMAGRDWTADEQVQAEDAAERIWDAIHHADTDRALRRRESRLAALFARAAAGLSEISLDGRFMRVNDELCRILDRPREWLLGARVADVTHPEDLAATFAALRRLLDTGEPSSLDKRYLRADGSVVYANSSLTRLDDQDGQAQSVLAVTIDMTERKLDTELLLRSRGELERRVSERTAELASSNAQLVREALARDALRQQMTTVQEEERRRISRDLHDQTGQLLASLSLALEAVRGSADLPDKALERLGEVRRIIDELSRQVHGLAVRLRPTALDDLGLEVALTELVAEWRARTGVAVDFQADRSARPRLPSAVETALYRVVQEGLTNVARHARAHSVSVVTSRFDGVAAVVIEDDGVGFDPAQVPPRRLGLLGMRERLALVGGTLEIESQPGAGTTLIARIALRGADKRSG